MPNLAKSHPGMWQSVTYYILPKCWPKRSFADKQTNTLFYFRENLNDYRLIVITDSIPLRLTVYFTSVWCWVITAYPVRMFDKASHWIFRGSKSFRASASDLRSSRPASVAWCLQEHLDDFFDDRCRICMNVHLWWMFTCFRGCWLVQLRRRSQEEHELFGPVIIFNF